MAYDVFFLNFHDPNADKHWEILQGFAPHAQRIDGVPGLLAAHKACAEKSVTEKFFVVDADNEVIDFDFRYRIGEGREKYNHLWYARNPVNGLEYGWGGIKLIDRDKMLAFNESYLDLSMKFPLHIEPKVASITHFNTTPFNAWRSAYREATKLTWYYRTNLYGMRKEAQQRLEAWCTIGHDKRNGAYAIRGANTASGGDLASSNEINDFQQLRKLFDELVGEQDA